MIISTKLPWQACSCLLLTLLLPHLALQAQNVSDPDWPCIQVKVPEISAASIWDGPTVDNLEQDPQLDKLTKPLINNVVTNGKPLTEEMLKNYLTAQNNGDRERSLSYLFKEFLGALNTKRNNQINSIKRYTSTQRISAANIENLLDQKAALKDGTQQVERHRDLDDELFWQIKMFKKRENSIKYFCELPQDTLQQAGEIARYISANLE